MGCPELRKKYVIRNIGNFSKLLELKIEVGKLGSTYNKLRKNKIYDKEEQQEEIYQEVTRKGSAL